MKRLVLIIVLVLLPAVGVFAQKDTLRILAIGNSFSEDAVEDHLYHLAKEEGITLIIGDMYKGRCSIERHVRNLREDIAEYKYRKIDAQGVKTEIPDYTLKQALADEQWDYVSFQQSSPNSGFPETYDLLQELVNYVKERVPEDAVMMFHQTWAFSKDSPHKEYYRYDNDQLKMFNAIVSAVSQVIPQVEDIKIVIPAGTAIQNARTSILGDDLTRDGHHLSRPHGRYVASCAWLQAVLGKNPVGNGYCPEAMTAKECRAAQKAARKAVRHPSKISRIR